MSSFPETVEICEECGHLAQHLVGRDLPGQVMRSGPRSRGAEAS